MRVIAGSARGIRLRVPPGLAVRPTPDRLREALFAALQFRLEGTAWWDACAGCGAVAIEALSRGARSAVLSEPDARARAAIAANLTAARVGQATRLLGLGWREAGRLLVAEGARFDYLYYDPPWAAAATGEFLLLAGELLRAGGRILVEHRRGDEPDAPPGLLRLRTQAAGGAAVTWLGRSTPDGAPAMICGRDEEG